MMRNGGRKFLTRKEVNLITILHAMWKLKENNTYSSCISSQLFG